MLSLFDIFDALSVHFFHIHLFHFVCYYMCSLAFKIVHHRLKLLTKIQSNINNRNFPVFAVIIYFCSSYTLVYYSFFVLNDDACSAGRREGAGFEDLRDKLHRG